MKTILPDLPEAPTVRLRRLHPGQLEPYRHPARFKVLACGRRFGKTALAINAVCEATLQGKRVGWFAPTYKLLLEAWREFRDRLAPVTLHAQSAEHRLELITGGLLEMWTLEGGDPARGRKYHLAVVDEAAMVADLERLWNAAIRPSLTDYRGGGWFLSTPKGRNYFWQMFQRGLDPAHPDWAAWQLPTGTNPHINPAEIEAARAELPEAIFAQEYLAQFLEDGAGVFRRVAERSIGSPLEAPEPGRTYFFGVDWGKHADFTVISVWDDTGREVYLDRFNQIDYAFQVGRLVALAERFHPTVILAESNSMGEPLIEQLRRQGLPVRPFHTSNASKSMVVESLALDLERGAVTLLDHPVATAEMLAFQMERLPSGLIRYGAPGGMHDDCVMARALGHYAARPTQPLPNAPATSRSYL